MVELEGSVGGRLRSPVSIDELREALAPASGLPERRRMRYTGAVPTLHWLGRDAVVTHHDRVPFHLLQDVPALSVGGPESENLIVQGDNLLALKALLPRYAGQVKCIYI